MVAFGASDWHTKNFYGTKLFPPFPYHSPNARMKLTTRLIITLFALGAILVRAEDMKLTVPGQPTPASPAPAKPAYTEAQILEVIGWFMGKNSQAETFEFTKEQTEAVVRGFQIAVAGKDSPVELKQIGPQVEEFVRKRQDVYMGRLKQASIADAAKFFAEIKKKPGVIGTPSGLYYEIVKQGAGPNAKASDTVRAHYTGTLIDGSVFDTSLKPRQPGTPVEPAEFPLDQVIEGWKEGLQKINAGGKIKLYIPAELAYRDEGRPGIPPASTLIFDIELIEIKAAPAAPAPAAPAPPAPAAK